MRAGDGWKPLRFDDGYETALRTWQSPDAKENVLILHGLLGHSGMLDGLGRPIAERLGVTCHAYDRRGTGQCTELRGDSPGLERTVLDVVQAARTVGGGRPVHLLAWCGSFGFATHAVNTAPETFKSLTLLAPLFAQCEGEIPVAAMKKFWGRAAGKPDDELVDGPDFWRFLVDEEQRHILERDDKILRKITPRLPKLFLDAVASAAAIAPKLDLPKAAMIARGDRIIDPKTSRQVAVDLFGEEKVFDVEGPHAAWWKSVDVIADTFARTALGR